MLNFGEAWASLDARIPIAIGRARLVPIAIGILSFCVKAKRKIIMILINAAAFAGLEVITWIGFLSTDGGRVANSVYTGAFTI